MLQHPIWMNRTPELQIRALDRLVDWLVDTRGFCCHATSAGVVCRVFCVELSRYDSLQEYSDSLPCSLEQYVTTRIHKRIFAPDMMSRKRDSELRMRIARLRFIGPDHLDIPATNRNDESWEKSVKALQVRGQQL